MLYVFPDSIAVAFAIALVIDDLVDFPATIVNAAGDYVASFIVARFANGKDWLSRGNVADGMSTE